MSPQLPWFIARAAGVVAWLLMTASVLWGIVLATKAFPSRRRPAWLLDLHRWLGGLTVAFLAVHLGALAIDDYVSFGLADLFLPGAASWHRGAVALGVIAFWVLIVVQLTSMMMRKMPRRRWRAVHLTSYAAFWLTSLHASFAGTDRTNVMYRVTSLVAIVGVLWAALYRMTSRRAARADVRRAATGGRLSVPSPGA